MSRRWTWRSSVITMSGAADEWRWRPWFGPYRRASRPRPSQAEVFDQSLIGQCSLERIEISRWMFSTKPAAAGTDC